MPSQKTVPASPPVHASSLAVPFGSMAHSGFDGRWDVWVARGAANDAITRRRLTLLVQVGLGLTAVLGGILLGR